MTAILTALCDAMGWATIDYSRPHSLKRFVIFTIFICIGYFVIWFYWQGRNWARIGVLLTSGASIFNLLKWNRTSPVLLTVPAHIMLATEAVLGAALLYYLNTRPVLEFFYPENKEAIPRYGWGRILLGLWTALSGFQHHFPAPSPLGATHQVVPTPPTIGSIVAVLVGVCLFAWGTRAGIVPPYRFASKPSADRPS